MVTSITLIADYYHEAARQRVLGWQSGVMSIGGFLYLCLGGVLADINWRVAFAIYAASLIILPLVLGHIRDPGSADRNSSSGLTAGALYYRPLLPTMALAFAGMVAFYMVPVHLPFYLHELDPDISAFATGWAVAFMPLSVGAGYGVNAAAARCAALVLIFLLGLVTSGSPKHPVTGGFSSAWSSGAAASACCFRTCRIQPPIARAATSAVWHLGW